MVSQQLRARVAKRELVAVARKPAARRVVSPAVAIGVVTRTRAGVRKIQEIKRQTAQTQKRINDLIKEINAGNIKSMSQIPQSLRQYISIDQAGLNRIRQVKSQERDIKLRQEAVDLAWSVIDSKKPGAIFSISFSDNPYAKSTYGAVLAQHRAGKARSEYLSQFRNPKTGRLNIPGVDVKSSRLFDKNTGKPITLQQVNLLQNKLIVKGLKDVGLKPVVSNGIVRGFESPDLKRSFAYTNSGIEAYNQEIKTKVPDKGIDLFVKIKKKEIPKLVKDVVKKFEADPLAKLKFDIRKSNVKPKTGLTKEQERNVLLRLVNTRGYSQTELPKSPDLTTGKAILASLGITAPDLPEKYLKIIENRERENPAKAGLIGAYQQLTIKELKNAIREMDKIKKNAPKEIEFINEFNNAVNRAPENLRYEVQQEGLNLLKNQGIKHSVKNGKIEFSSQFIGDGKDITNYGRYNILSKTKRLKELKGTPEAKRAKRELIGAKISVVADKALKSYVSLVVLGGAFKTIGGLKILSKLPNTIKTFGKVGLGVGATGLYGTSKVLDYKNLVKTYGDIGEDIFWAETHGELIGLSALSGQAYIKKVKVQKVFDKKQKIYLLNKQKAKVLKNDFAKIKAGKGERTLKSLGRKVDAVLSSSDQKKLANIYSKFAKVNKDKALRVVREGSVYRQNIRIKSDSPAYDAAIKFLKTGKTVKPKSYIDVKRYGVVFSERVGNQVKSFAIEFNLRGKKAVNIGLKATTGRGKIVGTTVFEKAIKRKAVDFPEFRIKDVYVSKIKKGKTGRYLKNPTIEGQLSNIEIRKATFGKRVLGDNQRRSLQSIFNNYKGEARLKRINDYLQKIYPRLGKEAKELDFQILRIDRKGVYRINKAGTLLKEPDIFIEVGRGKGNLPTRIGIYRNALKQISPTKVKKVRINVKGQTISSDLKPKILDKDVKFVTKESYKKSLNSKLNKVSKLKTVTQQKQSVNEQLQLKARKLEQVTKSIFTAQPKVIRPTPPKTLVKKNEILSVMTSLALIVAPSLAKSLNNAKKNLSASKTIQKSQIDQLQVTLTDLRQLQSVKSALSTGRVVSTPGANAVIVPIGNVPRARIPTTPKKPIGVFPVIPKKKKVVKKKIPTGLKVGYYVVVKKRGKLVKTKIRPLSRLNALDLLAYRLDRELMRSGKLVRAGSFKELGRIPNKIKGYYQKHKNKFRRHRIQKGIKIPVVLELIEKKKYIGDTKTELAQLKKARAKKKIVRKKPIRKVVSKKSVVKKKNVKRKPAKRKNIKKKVVKRRNTSITKKTTKKRTPSKKKVVRKKAVKKKSKKRKATTKKVVKRRTKR